MGGWFKRWLSVTIVVAGVIIGFGGQRAWEATDSASFGWRTVWALVAVLGLVLAAVTGIVQRVRADRRFEDQETAYASQVLELNERLETVRSDMRVRMNDVLDPVVETLAGLAAATKADRPAKLQALNSQALTAATLMIGPSRTRACLFELRTVKENGQEVRALAPNGSTGRSGKPRTTFYEGTEAGDDVIRMLERDEYLFCPDTDKYPPTGWDPSKERDYKTFISMTARVGTEVIGMLTVDAPEPGDLTRGEAKFLRVLATLIAAGAMIRDSP